MATTNNDVYWSKAFVSTGTAASLTLHSTGKPFVYTTSMTSTDDAPHECDVIQRLSEQYRRMNVYNISVL